MKKKITISDIALLAGVSKATVSYYLNGKYEKMSETTKEKIRQVIDKTNYQPNAMARSLNAKQSRLVGVLIGDITNSFANQIVKGINDYIRERGYQMIIGSSGYDPADEENYISSMAAIGVDGFIVQPTVRFETFWNSSGNEQPIVYFDSPGASEESFWVKTNNKQAVYEMTESLAEKGYEQFVLITASPYVLQTRMERLEGFEECLKQREISYELIVADEKTTPAELRERLSGYLNKEKSTCIFVINNWLLDKTYLALQEYRELIPEYVGVAGFDSMEWTRLAVPSITTVMQPAYEEGRAAARILIDVIETGDTDEPRKVLNCTANYMESTNRQTTGNKRNGYEGE